MFVRSRATRVSLAVSLLAAVPAWPQSLRDGQPIPIRNWTAPSSWSPAGAPGDAVAGRNAVGALEPMTTGSTPLPTPALALVAITPCRLVDTRGATGESGAFGPPIMAANETRTIPVLGNTRCGIPSTAAAYSLNFTVVPTGFLNYLSAWPTGFPPNPPTSILNSYTGAVAANAAVVASGNGGSFDVFVTNQTQVVIDINGYYDAASGGGSPGGTSGSTGPTGATGPAGPTGAMGPTGPMGATGATGATGPIGPTGPAGSGGGGSVGATGPTGPQGLPGPQGIAGPTGPQGLQGPQGPAGAQGPAGIAGVTGATGPTGPGGPAGPAGATGSAGPTGPGGPAGPTGATGPAGPNVLAAGSAPAPSLSFVNSPVTGLFSGGLNTIGIATAGVSRLSIGPTGTVELPGNITQGGTAFLTSTGTDNIALGSGALASNTGSLNSALGTGALQSNSGSENTAVGTQALTGNKGSENIAVGADALPGNAGNSNVAVGVQVMSQPNTGSDNTAVGSQALTNNTAGWGNTAIGFEALFGVSAGNFNTALGDGALADATGNNNIGVGVGAGGTLGSGQYNIDIGNGGEPSDSGIVRIGTGGQQTSVYIAGIYGNNIGAASEMVINSNGLIGVVTSSIRYKEDVRDMGGASSDLMRLRPVTFRYKKPAADGSKPLEYGLIAEEVEKVYPNLVFRNANGQVEGVQYNKLPALLLNEYQKQQRQLEQCYQVIRTLEQRLTDLETMLNRPAENRP